MSSRRDTEFERLMLPHLNAAHNLARWLVRDPALAEDLVQDAVLRALGYFASYRGGDPRAWLLRIVRRSAYDALEVRRTRMTASLDHTRPDAEGDVPAGPHWRSVSARRRWNRRWPACRPNCASAWCCASWRRCPTARWPK